MSIKKVEKLIRLFNEGNKAFVAKNKKLILSNVNERTLCGALSQHLSSIIDSTEYKNYYVDVEYNRNNGHVKTIINDKHEITSINCDIIVHSRGEIIKKDNLIAIETKKSISSEIEKRKDKIRLIALTKSSYDNNVWSNDGKTFPEHVCGYELGIYFEVNINDRNILLEYYTKGNLDFKEIIKF